MAAQVAVAQAAQDLLDLENCLTVCGLNTANLLAGITLREGCESLQEFAWLRPKEILDLAKNLRQRAGAARVHYSDRQIKALTGFQG